MVSLLTIAQLLERGDGGQGGQGDLVLLQRLQGFSLPHKPLVQLCLERCQPATWAAQNTHI